MKNNQSNNHLQPIGAVSAIQKKPENMTVKVLKYGKDFNDYEIKNIANGQISRTRVVFLAD